MGEKREMGELGVICYMHTDKVTNRLSCLLTYLLSLAQGDRRPHPSLDLLYFSILFRSSLIPLKST